MKPGLATLLAMLAVLLLVAAGLGRQDTSTPAPAQGDASGLRVVTYNIKHGQGNDDCDDEEAAEGTPAAVQCAVDLERTADIISSLEPDILAIQEVDRFWDRSGGVDQPTELVESLGMSACFGVNLNHEPDGHADEPHQYGTATLTTFPILDCDNTFLPTTEGWEQRGLLETRVEIEGVGEVAILNTHLQAGRQGQEEEAIRQRTEQAEFIADRIAEIDVPVIFMGDLNAEPDDAELEPLRNPDLELQDAWEIARDEDEDQDPDGFTSPASPDEDAERRIDYIFISGDIEVLSIDVPVSEDTRMASDHFPVVADLALVDTEATPAVTPERTPTEEVAPAEDPTVIIAPIEEPAVTPEPEEDGESGEEPQTPETTEEPVAQPTEEPEPTAEPTPEPTAEPTPPPTEEPEAEPTEDADPPVQATTEPAPEQTAEPVGDTTAPVGQGAVEPAVGAVGQPAESPAQPPVEPAESPTEEPASDQIPEPTANPGT